MVTVEREKESVPKAVVSSLSIRLLGPFDVRRRGEPLPPLRSKKGQWLLALLVLRHGREIRREWLAETLWPDNLGTEALTSLRQSLADLRKALGEEAHRLQSPTARTLKLDLTDAEADVIAFDRAITRGDTASLERAVALYRGPLLEGCSELWVLPEREARQQSYLQALATLAERHTAAGDTAGAVRYLRLGAAVDPWQQSLHRALMQALAKTGDVEAAVQVYYDLRRLLHENFNAEPHPETSALYQRIRSRARRQALPLESISAGGDRLPPACHVPRPLTALVDREAEVRAIEAQLLSARLVMLIGTGGIGKTRLAIQVAQETFEEYADGAWFVDLAALTHPALVPQEVAAALGVLEERGRAWTETLRDFLRPRQLLLILDNCEMLVEACALLAQALLSECPGLRILATSRQKLGLTGEVAWRVPSLALPPETNPFPTGQEEREEAAALNQYAAARLFLERAHAAASDFTLTERNVAAVAQICRRLDGIPLALELAAALVEALSVEEIAARLENRFALLTGGDSTRPRRHQTLRAMLDGSFDLLTGPERVLFRRLAVFAGGWTPAAAEVVCADAASAPPRPLSSLPPPPNSGGSHTTPASQLWGEKDMSARYGSSQTWGVRGAEPQSKIETDEILNLLRRLVSKSLVLAEENAGRTRYRLLETVRQYAGERLREAGEEESLRERHRDYFLRLAEEAEPGLTGAEQSAWLERLEAEHENLRAALEWRSAGEDDANKALRLAGALGRFWQIRGYFGEGRAMLASALLRGNSREQTAERANALGWAGFLAIFQSDYAEAQARYEESRVLWDALGEKRGLAAALGGLGVVEANRGDYAGALACYAASMALAREVGDTVTLAGSLGYLGIVEANQGAFTEARTHFEESLAIRRERGDRWGIAACLNNLGVLDRRLGRPESARAFLEESLAIRRELGDRRSIAITLNNLGMIACLQGDYTAARAHFTESLTLSWELGDKQSLAYSLEAFARLAAAQGQFAQATTLYAAADALRVRLGSPLPPPERADPDRDLAAARKTLGEAAFTQAQAAGRALSLEQAVASALAEAAGIIRADG